MKKTVLVIALFLMTIVGQASAEMIFVAQEKAPVGKTYLETLKAAHDQYGNTATYKGGEIGTLHQIKKTANTQPGYSCNTKEGDTC